MIRKKIKVALVSTKNKNKDDEGMIKIAKSLNSNLSNLEIISEIISTKKIIFSSKHYDVIHYVGGPTLRTFILSFICEIFNPKVVTIITFTNPIISLFSSHLIKFFKPDLCLISSNRWKFFLNEKNIRFKEFNLSGVDINQFKYLNKSKNRLKKKYNIPLNKKIILHVGHIKEGRNIGIFKYFRRSNLFQVIIVGSTVTKQNIKLKNELVNCGVKIITNYIKKIEEIYQLSDLYVFPVIDHTQSIQVPLSILEALSCQIPVLSSNFEGINKRLKIEKFNIEFFNPKKLNYYFNSDNLIRIMNKKKKII